MVRRIALFLALLCGFSASSEAGTLRVAPIRVEVEAGRRFCALTVGNDSDRPVSVQVRGFGWTRDELGVDRLDPTSGPAVNPPISAIPAGDSRLIRCSLPAPDPARHGEEQWRLVVDELPSAEVQMPGTVQTLLRLSIPVFRAEKAAAPRLGWSLTHLPDGSAALRLSNSGTRHAQISQVTLNGTQGGQNATKRGFYLLAGGSILLPLDHMPQDAAKVVAESDFGRLEALPDPSPYSPARALSALAK